MHRWNESQEIGRVQKNPASGNPDDSETQSRDNKDREVPQHVEGVDNDGQARVGRRKRGDVSECGRSVEPEAYRQQCENDNSCRARCWRRTLGAVPAGPKGQSGRRGIARCTATRYALTSTNALIASHKAKGTIPGKTESTVTAPRKLATACRPLARFK